MKTFILGVLLTVFGGIYYLKFYRATSPIVIQKVGPPVQSLKPAETPKPTQVKTKMYRWVDENGVKQFSQSPPLDPGIKTEIIEVVSQADPENPVLMYSDKLKGKSLTGRSSGESKMIRSARQPNSSACNSAKRTLRSVRTQSYKNRSAHLQRVARYKARVKRACR
ncbi:MAG: DUF4124 domain-containing protein [Agarilytica sp.]